MFIAFTIYPSIKYQPTVGYDIFDNADRHIFISGQPNLPISEFKRIIQGTDQYNDFLHQCNKLGIDLSKWCPF